MKNKSSSLTSLINLFEEHKLLVEFHISRQYSAWTTPFQSGTSPRGPGHLIKVSGPELPHKKSQYHLCFVSTI